MDFQFVSVLKLIPTNIQPFRWFTLHKQNLCIKYIEMYKCWSFLHYICFDWLSTGCVLITKRKLVSLNSYTAEYPDDITADILQDACTILFNIKLSNWLKTDLRSEQSEVRISLMLSHCINTIFYYYVVYSIVMLLNCMCFYVIIITFLTP